LVLELSEDGSEYRVVGIANEVLPETHAQSTREKVLQAIRVLGEATRTEIEEYLREIGEKIPERTIRDALLRLYEDGKVERERVGRGGAFVYRAAEVGNLASWQSLNTLPSCQNLDAPTAAPPAAPPEPYTYSCNRAIVQPLNTLHDCTNSAAPEPTPYAPRSESFEEWLARADTVLDHFCPSFHARAELTWDTIDDWLQQASMPHDPLGLEPHEVEAIRLLLAFAEARGFPPLTIPAFGYTIRAGQAGWLNALPDIAGTPAVAVATRLLQSLDAAGSPDAPAPTPINGNAGLTPLQLSLLEG
jgi:DNA-binding transcriptional ArsR family regulator